MDANSPIAKRQIQSGPSLLAVPVTVAVAVAVAVVTPLMGSGPVVRTIVAVAAVSFSWATFSQRCQNLEMLHQTLGAREILLMWQLLTWQLPLLLT